MRLVVVDGYRRELRHATVGAGSAFFLAVHYPPQVLIDASRRQGQDLRHDMFLPIVPLAKQAKEAIRLFVPRFYAQLPTSQDELGRSLAKTLFPGDPAVWWLTDLSEKSIFRGRLITRLYTLALLREAVEAHQPAEVWIALSDNMLSESIADSLGSRYKVRVVGERPWRIKCRKAFRSVSQPVVYPCRVLVMAWGTLLESLLLRIVVGSCVKSETDKRTGRRVALFSFFPGWWRNAWDDDRRREVFYQNLPQRLTASGLAVRYVVWLRIRLNDLIRHAADIRRLCRTGVLHCLQSLGGLRRDAALLGFKPLLYCMRALRWRPAGNSDMFAGFDIGGLVKNELLGSLSNRELFRNLLLRDAVEGLTGNDLMLFRTEFQPFERSILQGLRSQHIVTVGYQHSSVGKDYLSHLFEPGQFQGKHAGSADWFSIPDHIIATGGHVARLMMKNGFRPERVHVAGPLRYQDLRNRLRSGTNQPPAKDGKGRHALLIPVSLDRCEAMGFAAVLAAALAGIEDRFTLDIKAHPANDHALEFITYLRRECNAVAARLVPKDANLYDYIGRSKALVMTGSTVGLEAIALGTPVIMFVNDHIFSYTASSLNAVGQAVVNVRDAASLRAALERLHEEEVPFPEMRQFWPHAITEMFHDLDRDPEEQFCAIVNGILNGDQNPAQSAAGSII